MVQTTAVKRTETLLAGIALMLVGGVFLLRNIGYLDLGNMWIYWPLLVVALGLYELIKSHGKAGLWLLLIGLWLLVSTLRLFGLGFGNSWPLLIAATGLVMIWEDLGGRVCCSEDDHES